jgi:kynurenine 3-monooxygenase
MRIHETHKVTIIGAGMSGTLLAILLAQRGFQSELFDASADPRTQPPHPLAPAILSLGERGRYALRAAGLEDAVGAHVTSMRGRMIHDRRGQTNLQPYGVHAYEALYSIPRERLVHCLLDAAEASGKVALRFGQRLMSIDWNARQMRFEHSGERPFEVLIGTDGAGSKVRSAMQRATDLTVVQESLDAGYKQLLISADAAGTVSLDRHALHVWPRGGYMMIAMPDTDGNFPAMLFLPCAGDHRMPWGFEELDSWTRQKAFMEFNFPDATDLMPRLEQEFRDHPVGHMGTIRCSRWHLDGLGLLLGDAAHTIVPFHGQGVNAAFEDCTTLTDIIDGGAGDWATAFERLEGVRIADAEAIADMALDAFRTMRDSVRHRDFLLRKALERELEQRHAGVFIPRYSLVMFHRIPYAEAHRRGRIQAEILDELLDGKSELADVDLDRASVLVAERLATAAA